MQQMQLDHHTQNLPIQQQQQQQQQQIIYTKKYNFKKNSNHTQNLKPEKGRYT